jgi:DNA-binding LacI/PurR family transcriptional regulator
MTVRDTQTRRVRLEDVAVAAGVSKSIASRILNDDSDLSVRVDTRERVLEAAQRLNYRPHAAARGLRGAKTGALGLLIPDLTMPVYARIVRGAVERALERDFAVLLAEDRVAHPAEDVLASLVQAGRIDGLIVASARPGHPLLRLLRRYGIPHVFVNRSVPESGRNVVMNDAGASEAAVDHLVELGHARIGHVAGPRKLDPARRRRDAFVRHAAELDLPGAPAVEGEFSEDGGAAAARSLLGRHARLTALYTSSLSHAVGALDTLWRLERRVPEDVSLISYDDMPLAEFLRPPVTTIKMPLAELGAAGVDALLDQLRGGSPQDVTIADEPEIVVRMSTAEPRADS